MQNIKFKDFNPITQNNVQLLWEVLLKELFSFRITVPNKICKPMKPIAQICVTNLGTRC